MLEGRNRLPWFELTTAQIEANRRAGELFPKYVFPDWNEELRTGLPRNLLNPVGYRFSAETTLDDGTVSFFDSSCDWSLIPEY